MRIIDPSNETDAKKTTKCTILRIVFICLIIFSSQSVIAQAYNNEDVFGLFAERKIFYPDFNYAVNSSVGLETIIDDNGESSIRFVINGKIAPLYLKIREIQRGNNIVFIARDDNGFGAQFVVTLLSSGKMRMYFLPVKTETADIFVYGFNQQRTYAYSWYEPSMSGLVSHPETESRNDAIKNYFSSTYDRSFDEIINDGKYIISRKRYDISERRRKREEELRRQRIEEERRRREEAERIRRENTVFVTVKAPQLGRDVIIEMNGKVGVNVWQDSLLIGNYSVKYTSDSYKDSTTTIEVTHTDTLFVLNRMIPKTTHYTFNSPEKQIGASVYVNDRYVGTTPVVADINLVEPNKIEYSAIDYSPRIFYLTYDKTVTISTSPNAQSQKVSGVNNVTNAEVTTKMKKDRSGGVDEEGNGYSHLGFAITSYPSMSFGLISDHVGKHFDFAWSLNLNHRDNNLFFQTGIKFGWGFSGNYFRITPQIGWDIDWGLKEKLQHNDQGEAYMGTVPYAAMMYFPLGVKFEYALWRWFVIAVTPEASLCGTNGKMYYGLRFYFTFHNNPERSLGKKKGEVKASTVENERRSRYQNSSDPIYNNHRTMWR